MASGDAVAEIKDKLDMVEVVSGYVRLKRQGKEYLGLCPFHSEKTPSFWVNADMGTWYCFGCNEGGDLFNFVEKAEGTDFPETLRMLADRAGVTLDENRGGRRRAREKEIAREANRLATQYFHHILVNLPGGGPGRRYLEKRGVSEEMIEAFQVGYAPLTGRNDNLLRFLKKHGISDEDAVRAGLALQARGTAGGATRPAIDRFRGRLMFPIKDESGTVVGFGGRAMDSTPPKYMNTPQTALYDKSRVVYGLANARKKIAETERALLVEGYFDVIMAHQNGIGTAVASSGTAVTAEQVKILRRFANELYLCLDSDDAGQHATERAIEMAARAGMRVRVVELVSAKDPGDFFLKTPELWEEAEGAALAGWEWWINRVLKASDLRTAEGRSRAAQAVVPVLNRIPEEATLDIYCQVAAERLRLDPARLLVDVQRQRGAPQGAHAPAPAAPGPPPPMPALTHPTPAEEDRLLTLLIGEPRAPQVLAEITGGDPVGSHQFQELCSKVIEGVADGAANLERHLDRLEPEDRARVARLSLTAMAIEDDRELRAALQDCVDRMRLKSYEAAMAAVEERLRALPGDDDAQRDSLLEEHRLLARRRAELKHLLFQGRA